MLRQGLKNGKKQIELNFLNGNVEKTIIENYFWFYLRPIGVFSQSMHRFDHEYTIEEKLNQVEICDGIKRVSNYQFFDSINQPLIQLSDCVVGIVGKYHTYVNSIDIVQANRNLGELNNRQRETLKLFSKIILKSEQLSPLLFNYVGSQDEYNISSFILQEAINF